MSLKFLPWLFVVAFWICAALAWPSAPDVMPAHWGISGEPDGYGSKAMALLGLPGVATAMAALLPLVQRIDPNGANYRRMEGAFLAVQTALQACLFATYLGAIGWVAMRWALPVALSGLFLVIGLTMGKVRPNLTFGIRTPWTVASVQSWSRTHRLAGFVFVGLGVAIFGAGLHSVDAAFLVLMVGTGGGVFGLSAYSWHVWKHDPVRTPVTQALTE